jgi:hypothetical protein
MNYITKKFLLFTYAMTIIAGWLVFRDFAIFLNETVEWWEIVDFFMEAALEIFLIFVSIKFTLEKLNYERIERINKNEDV